MRTLVPIVVLLLLPACASPFTAEAGLPGVGTITIDKGDGNPPLRIEINPSVTAYYACREAERASDNPDFCKCSALYRVEIPELGCVVDPQTVDRPAWQQPDWFGNCRDTEFQDAGTGKAVKGMWCPYGK